MKKLTAGIFTVMLGLCATSGADAAVASQGYVDTKVGVNTQSITELTQTVATNKTAAENAIAGETSARETAVSGLNTRLTTAEGTIAQHTTDISAINAELDTVASSATVTALQTQVGTGTVDSRIETAKQAAIDAAAADATTKANKALEDAKADAEKYIDAAELTTAQSEQNTAIETAYTAADKKITDSIGTVPADKTVVGMIAEAQTAATYDDTTVKADIAKNAGAIATLNGNDQTEGSVAYKVKALADGAVATNTAAIETNADDISGLKTLVGTTAVATQISSAIADANLSQYATKEGLTGALADYAKTEELKALAKKDTVGTDDIDNLAVTTDKLANGAVDANKLAENAVTNAAVADGALSQGKINGLNTTLAAKMDITSTTTQAGKYVFTANVGENGVTDYAWEEIARD